MEDSSRYHRYFSGCGDFQAKLNTSLGVISEAILMTNASFTSVSILAPVAVAATFDLGLSFSEPRPS